MTRIDLNHVIEADMVTYKGLPGPIICDYWTREASAQHFSDGSSFQIARIDMVANTGTYIDSPFHRRANGHDIAEFQLDRIAGVDGLLVRAAETDRIIGREFLENAFAGASVNDKAVLIHTGWDRHWRSERYFDANPCLSADAAAWLRDEGAILVGIDSLNIDDATTTARPVHTALLDAGIAIVEHLCHLDELPDSGFRFFAVPPRMKGVGTFPVRAWAEIA